MRRIARWVVRHRPIWMHDRWYNWFYEKADLTLYDASDVAWDTVDLTDVTHPEDL